MRLAGALRINIFRYTFLSLAGVCLAFSSGLIKATYFGIGREAYGVYFSSESERDACSFFSSQKKGYCEDKSEVISENEMKTIRGYTLRVPHLYILEDLYTEQLLATLKADQVLRSPITPSVPAFKTQGSWFSIEAKFRHSQGQSL
jgi:hypothetical protein